MSNETTDQTYLNKQKPKRDYGSFGEGQNGDDPSVGGKIDPDMFPAESDALETSSESAGQAGVADYEKSKPGPGALSIDDGLEDLDDGDEYFDDDL
jgi:hypothetical protein